MPASLAPFIFARPWLYKLFKPAAAWYANAATYRQLGLQYVSASFPWPLPFQNGPIACYLLDQC